MTGALAGTNAVQNNFLSNTYGVERLDKQSLALYEKLKAAGIGSIDELQKRFTGCAGDGECERGIRNEYRQQEKQAGETLVGLYKAGKLSQEELAVLVTDYSIAMMAGAKEGQLSSHSGGYGDIYSLSGIDWTPMGVIGNPYLDAIKKSGQIAQWRREGLSEEKINELAHKSGLVDSVLVPVDVPAILEKVDNGASQQGVLEFAGTMLFGKFVANAVKGTGTGKAPYTSTVSPDAEAGMPYDNPAKEAGPKATGQTLREVEISSGGKEAWSKDLNKPEANTIYKVDGNKTYQTDSMGPVERVESDLSYAKNDRNTYQQCVAGKCGVSGDEGGHLIASVFNGPGEKLNLLPMNGNLNKGAWKSMENTWANALKDGKPVNVKIEPIYSGSSVRPDRFNVKYSIDGGRPVNVDFKNAPGGGG